MSPITWAPRVASPAGSARINKDLEVQDLESIPDDQLAFDILFMQGFVADAAALADVLYPAGCSSQFQSAEQVVMSLPFCRVLGDLDRQCSDSIAEKKEDLFCCWGYDNLFCSETLQLAMRDREISIGNLLNQWREEKMNRGRK